MWYLPSRRQKHGSTKTGDPKAVMGLWNSLPTDIRACTFYGSFKRRLKSFYFNNAI